MKQPPEYFIPILLGIESTVVDMHKEFPRLGGTDIEWVFEKLSDYFKMKSKNKDAPEPESPSEMKQALLDEILNTLDEREEEKADVELINNPDVLYGEHMIPSLEKLYVTIFKSLKDSARFWRKKDGRNGYINHISDFLSGLG